MNLWGLANKCGGIGGQTIIQKKLVVGVCQENWGLRKTNKEKIM